MPSCIWNWKCFHFVFCYELVFSSFSFCLYKFKNEKKNSLSYNWHARLFALGYYIISVFLHVNYVFQLYYMPKEALFCNLPSGCHLYTQLTTDKYRKKFTKNVNFPSEFLQAAGSLYFIVFLSSLQSIDSSCATKYIEFSRIHNIKAVYSFFLHAV